jgi:DNA-binding CsgD family transcriptional regulator/PAS domain-containing protein
LCARLAPSTRELIVVREAEHLSSLIGDIYDAALDATLWVDVLGKARDFIGGHAAALARKDAVGKCGDVFYEDGAMDPYYTQIYFEKYIKFDPFTTAQFFAEIGTPVSSADIMPFDEFSKTRFFKEWVQPQGLVDGVVCPLDKGPTSVALFLIFRHQRQGLTDEETRRRMRVLAPHVRRAVLIGKVLDSKKAETATFATTLNGIRAGMFLVDATGCIVHANVAGHAMLDKANVLRASGGRLVACDSESDQALADIFAMAGNGDTAIGVKGIALPLTAEDGERHVCHVLPLTSGTRRHSGAAYKSVAAMFVHRAALDTPSLPEAVAKTYKLTPTELRVLFAIVEVGGVPEVAEALGVSTETVKTHLGRLYTKTGARRQVDLAKLVAGFTSPLLG